MKPLRTCLNLTQHIKHRKFQSNRLQTAHVLFYFSLHPLTTDAILHICTSCTILHHTKPMREWHIARHSPAPTRLESLNSRVNLLRPFKLMIHLSLTTVSTRQRQGKGFVDCSHRALLWFHITEDCQRFTYQGHVVCSKDIGCDGHT